MLIKIDTKIDFVGKRFISWAICAIVFFGTILSLCTRGLSYGIDFKGGILMEITTKESNQLSKLRNVFSTMNIGDVSLQEFGSDKDLLIRIEAPEGGETAINKVVSKVKSTLGDDVSYRRIETIGPKVGSELIMQSFWAVFFSMLAILLYIWVRYEWQFALASIIALICDCMVILGFYSVFKGYEFTINSIVAILMTAGYSVNDKVVVFDRINEDLRDFGRAKDFNLASLINNSLNCVLSRTILTSLATIICLLPLYLLGGDVIAAFSLPMIIGIVFGTFTSIYFASTLVLVIGYKVKRND